MKSTDFLTMPTDPIRAALERLLQVIKFEYNETDEIIAFVQAITAARDALAAEPLDPAGGGEALLAAAPAPLEGEEPTTEELNRLYREIYGLHSDVLGPMPRNFARAVLARWGRPAAPVPDEGEVAELVEWLLQRCQLMSEAPGSEFHLFTRAATLLQQQAAELAALRAGVVPLTAAQLELLKDVLDAAEDEGSHGEGWASPQLQKLRGSVSTWQAAPQGGEVE